MVRLPRHPDQRHRPDGPRDAGADRRRPGADAADRHQRPRAQAEEAVHAPVLSWPAGPRPRQNMLSTVGGALKSIRLDDRHYAVCAAHTDTACPHVHVAVSRVDPETGRAVNLDSRATKRLSRWAEQYERDHGGIVVPTRVERRKAQAARRDLERRCRKAGCRAGRPARPPRGCTRDRRRSPPGRDRPHRIWPSVTPRSYASRGSRSAISADAPNSVTTTPRPARRSHAAGHAGASGAVRVSRRAQAKPAPPPQADRNLTR